jgi:tetratricopeptide (TPR) repeat protein
MIAVQEEPVMRLAMHRFWPYAAIGLTFVAVAFWFATRGNAATEEPMPTASESDVEPEPDAAAPEAAPAESTPPEESDAATNDAPSPVEETAADSAVAQSPPQPAELDGVRPGTSAAELHQKWDQPKRTARITGGTREIFRLEKLGEARVTIVDDAVASLAVHVENPQSLEAVAGRLSIDGVEPVDVYDEHGELLGAAYPERGVLLGYVPRSRPKRVFQILIEPVDAEMFLARAEKRLETRYADCLGDVRQVLALDPASGLAYRLQAEVALRSGDLDGALKHAQKAVELASEEREYRLLVARVLAASGEYPQAITRVRDLIAEPKVGDVVAARAHCLWGDYLALSSERDFGEAIGHHQQAIKLAEPLVNHELHTVRRAAKEVLLDAHLGVAYDVGWGRWQQKVATTAKWIERASLLADDLQSHERAGPEVRMRVYLGALAALAGIAEPPPADKWIQGAQKLGKRMYDEAVDPAFRAQLAWQVARGLSHAVEIETARHQSAAALALGKMALALYDESRLVSERLPTRDYERGKLCYRLGAVEAVERRDHVKAVEWFEKAAPLLESPVPSTAIDAGTHGEMFVSMAVSYWDQENRREALRLTSQGLKLMEQAVGDGDLESAALAVPYGNLASMHEAMGDYEQAQKYSEMSSRYERQAAK